MEKKIWKEEDISFDLIFAYNDPNNRSSGTLYLGKWNDGIVN